jgi:hypothetical protein
MEMMERSYSVDELSDAQLDQVAGGWIVTSLTAYWIDRIRGWNCDDGQAGTTWRETICQALD